MLGGKLLNIKFSFLNFKICNLFYIFLLQNSCSCSCFAAARGVKYISKYVNIFF